MIRVKTWCRADFAGGTLDIWPLGLLHPGARTINVALDLAVDVRLELRPRGFLVRQDGESVEARAEETRRWRACVGLQCWASRWR